MTTRSITLQLVEENDGLYRLEISDDGFDGDSTTIALVLNLALSELAEATKP